MYRDEIGAVYVHSPCAVCVWCRYMTRARVSRVKPPAAGLYHNIIIIIIRRVVHNKKNTYYLGASRAENIITASTQCKKYEANQTERESDYIQSYRVKVYCNPHWCRAYVCASVMEICKIIIIINKI